MKSRLHTSMHLGLAMAVGLAFSSPAWGQDSSAGAYALNPGTTYQTGCFPPCLCPISQEFDLRGTFDLSFIGSDLFFDYYSVSNVDWKVLTKTATVVGPSITGSGIYRIGGDFALAQWMVLDLKMDDLPIQHLHSGFVLGGAAFPEIKIMLTVNDMVCFDTVIRLDAAPTGACCDNALAGGPCFETTRRICESRAGSYQGNGTTCPNDLTNPCGEVCGGFAGIPCTNASDFCKLPTGRCCCDFQGVCTPKPEACPENYDPVCGCDSVTYGNECEADAAGISVDHRGECPTGACCLTNSAGTASCLVLSETECSDRSGDYQGEGTTCPTDPSLGCGQVCGGFAGIQCANESEYCRLPVGQCCCDFQGLCAVIPEVCPAFFDPVCGCNGITYGNDCEAAAAGVSVDHRGSCAGGACCLPNIAAALPCVIASEIECVNQGGSYQGDGSQCPADLTSPCEGPTGACCADLGGIPIPLPICFETTAQECEGGFVFFEGKGTTCESVSEACCLPSGNCVEVGAKCCSGFGGVSRGPGSFCDSTLSTCGQVCGGIAGIPCDNENDFCKLPEGNCCCDVQGICTPMEGCAITLWDPVCGCDGVTYGLECHADAAGVSVDHRGECASGCGPTDDGFACKSFPCSVIPEISCSPSTLHLDIATGAITVVDCRCQDFNDCHIEFGNASPRAEGNCPDNGTCDVVSEDTDNDNIDDQFSAVCVNTGACCMPILSAGAGSCVILSNRQCLNEGGAYQGDNSTCPSDNTSPCGTPRGACCHAISTDPASACTLTTELNCILGGGNYQGDNSACALASCELPPTGACCLDNATGTLPCVIATEAACGDQSGVYQGDDSTCPNDSTLACGAVTGACCFSPDDPSLTPCLVTTPEVCLARGGAYQGDGLSCETNTCCCCFADGGCTNMPEAICAEEGGSFRLGGSIPAVSQWGLVIFTLLILSAASIVILRRGTKPVSL